MQFSVLTVLGFASAAVAEWVDPTPGFNAITKPGDWEVVPAGKAYDIEWAPTAQFPEAITITLYGGPARNALNPVETIASGVDSADGTYSWDVAANLGSHTVYGLFIQSETNKTRNQWGNPFTIKSGKGSVSSTVSSTVSESTSATASATETKTATNTTRTSETKTATLTQTTLTTTFPANRTTTTAPTQINTITTTIIDEEVTETSTSTVPTSTNGIIPSGAAAVGSASSFALLGGVALAVLAF